MESSLKYQPGNVGVLTQVRYPDRGQCVVGSLTGAVSSQRVTEEHEGALIMVGNHEVSVKAQARLTARLTSRAGRQLGLSDPVVKPHGPLVLVSSTPYDAYTPSLSTSWSWTALQGTRSPREISSWEGLPA